VKKKGVVHLLGGFISDETAQDTIEYGLLLAFIALAGAAMFIGMSASTNTLWSIANSNLAAGNAGS
jgi:Flp pilus assembly pilin Flp